MLEELRKYENLGTPKYFWELLTQLDSRKGAWSVDDTQHFFFNRIIEGASIFDGCISFAEAIGIIHIDSKGHISIDSSLVPMPRTENHLCNKIIERVFVTLRDDDTLQSIFCSENMSYDIIYRSIQIENSAFGLKYSNFKSLLISFNFLIPHPDTNIPKYIVNGKYKKLFDKLLLPEIKRRKIGIDELRKSFEQKQINGDEAENFVLAYEKRRLFEHASPQQIEKISEYDVAAGYDVVSYLGVESETIDKFIEVKSFSGTPYFYWSRNEIDAARIRKDSYFLYLVDRDKMQLEDYEPTIVQNPYTNILSNNDAWSKRVESYFISQA